MLQLTRESETLVNVEVADSFARRLRGLIMRKQIEGTLLISRTNSVHTFFMRFPIDVAFLDEQNNVLEIITMKPWRVSKPRRGAKAILEARAGAFAHWGVQPGDVLGVGV